jgi:sigma-B regulation protein RsbU (phosphoserine phosphatase)
VEVVGRTGTLLGVLAEPLVHDTDVALGPGDLLLLYTDGVTEARQERDFFGDERLADAVDRHRAAEDVSAALVAEVVAYQAGVARDDIAVVAVRVPPGRVGAGPVG